MKISSIGRVIRIIPFLLSSLVATISVAQSAQFSPQNNSDYVLIINSYTESSDWSNSFIRPVHEAIAQSNSNLTAYTEHMNMLMVNDMDQVESYKKSLFDKYAGRTPKLVMLLGNSPWALLREDLEAVWSNTPVIFCAEQDFMGSKDSYVYKTAVQAEEQMPLVDYKGPLKVTVIKTPIFIKETIEAMKLFIPNMKKIVFLSDLRYTSIQSQVEIEQVMARDYPNVELEELSPKDINVSDLADYLKKVKPTTGILYMSWYRTSSMSGNVLITTNDYKMFSRYTNLPIFTLTDNEISTSGMLGGVFYDNKQIGDIVQKTFNEVIRGKNRTGVTVVDFEKAVPVINHAVLEHKGFSDKICPDDTIFYMKRLSLWEEYKYYIIIAILITFSIYSFMVMKVSMLRKIRAKQGEQILLMKNYRSLFDNMPIAYSKQELVYDADRKIVDYVVKEINPYYEKYFVSADSPIGKQGSSVDDSSFREYLSLYELAIAEHRAITVQHYNNETNRYFSMIIVPSKIDVYMDIFYVDNTELYTAQQLMRTLNRKLSMALDVANITPWKWDLDKGTILCDVSRSSESSSEDEAQEELAVPYKEYFSKICKRDMARVRAAYNDLLSGKINKIKEEYRVFVNRDGKHSYEWVEAQAVVDKRDESGRPLSLIGSSLVISDRKKMEADLIDAKEKAEESNRLKSAFLANMSHEIRTPLNAIVGFSEVLATADNEQDKHEYVSIIENNNTLLLQLISDILDLSKIEAGTLEFIYSTVNLNEMLNELETTFRMRVDENVEVIFDNKLPKCWVRMDKNRLTQVIINVVNNAIKFTTHGSIRFGYCIKDNKTLEFSITDTGCGIPADRLDSIFGRFVKLNNFVQGTGLGLSICQTIIHNMGGQINVESVEGEGTRFWFTLPYEPVEEVKTEQLEVELLQIEKARLTVLIAEDNASNFKLFEAILKNDYKIYHAWDGEQAVQMFKQHKPHIVLMDINMPKMNGYEATQQIREMSTKVPIIAVTAYAYSSDERRIIDSGFDGYAAKPVNSQMLRSQMINLLKRQLIFV